ncbi:hypothetical protein RJ640_030800 [Escallonia rubra]|uniref:RING-type domain-containing protein n=1 Tax=Escallonia rubra TaxID=112253 RepID=A0AA88S6X7_9ASTE|nr:hypothetical protein RJ640_030800 [Escallonia rubra]
MGRSRRKYRCSPKTYVVTMGRSSEIASNLLVQNLQIKRRIMGHDVGLCFLRQDGEAARLRNGNNETSRHTTRPLLVPQQGQETCATTPPQPQTIKQQADEVRIILFNDVCAICSDDIKYGERCRALPNCSHMYHQQCLDEWLKINEDCPLCRAYLTKMSSVLVLLVKHLGFGIEDLVTCIWST